MDHRSGNECETNRIPRFPSVSRSRPPFPVLIASAFPVAWTFCSAFQTPMIPQGRQTPMIPEGF